MKLKSSQISPGQIQLFLQQLSQRYSFVIAVPGGFRRRSLTEGTAQLAIATAIQQSSLGPHN